MFDVWVRDFVRRHPEGTVVEIGAGLNTRFERLDNGSIHWYDLELPDMVELRRTYFSDSERRVTLAASVLDRDWIETVRRSPGPYFLVAETVFVYLEEAAVKTALGQIGSGLPQATIALDTVGRRAVDTGNRDFARRKMAARFHMGLRRSHRDSELEHRLAPVGIPHGSGRSRLPVAAAALCRCAPACDSFVRSFRSR